MIWIVLISTIVFLFYLLILRGMKGPAKTIETIDRAINDLLMRGYDGGFLMIDIAHTSYFLQLQKYINSPGDYGIKFCFPNADWSRVFFQKMIDYTRKNEVEYSIMEKSETGSLEFFCVDFHKNTHEAHNFVKNILLNVFKVNEKVKLFVRLENATTEDKLIDR